MTASPGTATGTVGRTAPTGPRPPVRTEVLAGALAAATAMAAYCLAMALHGTAPFGGRSRASSDLGNQFVPFHAHLWDLQHGATHGGLFFNWNSGFGVPFLPDFFTYLANPFSWMVGLFPRNDVDLPVFLVTLFGIGLGSALMTHYLGRLRPGSPWLRALLGVGFGLCGWAVNDAAPDPMWTWGLVSLPLLGIAVDWCLQGRRWVLGTLLVALCWFGNFYTAAMATLATGLVLAVRLLLDDRSLRQRGLVLLRAGSMVVTGLMLTAPVMLVSLQASKAAQPIAPLHLPFPTIGVLFTELLPGAPISGSRVPFWTVGMLGLLLVLAFPFVRAVPGRERIGWCLLLVLTALSFLWKPTLLVWQGGAVPNGSPFRDVFVLCGMMVMVAWLSLSRRPRPVALLGGAGLVAALCLVAGNTRITLSGHQVSQVYLWLSVLVGGGLALLGLLGLHLGRGNRIATRAVGAVLAASTFLCGAITVYGAAVQHDQLPSAAPHPTMDPQTEAVYRAVQAEYAAGVQRPDSGPHLFADNDPMLLNSAGGAYYSSYVPASTANALGRLGMGWYIAGRHTRSPSDPVSRALMGVTSYVPISAPGDLGTQYSAAAPLVTVHPDPAQGARAATVFALQEDLLRARVWETPVMRQTGGPAARRLRDASGAPAGWQITPNRKGGPWSHFTGHCTAGSQVYLNVPWFSGHAEYAGVGRLIQGARPMTWVPLAELGTVPPQGRVDVAFSPAHGAQPVPEASIGCLDTGRLASAVARLRADGARQVSLSGHGFQAALPEGSTGTAVMATALVTGWTCSVDGGAGRTPVSYDGLLGVPLGSGGRDVSCSYTPPGLRTGLLGTGAGVLVLVAVAGYALRRRRLAAQAAPPAALPV